MPPEPPQGPPPRKPLDAAASLLDRGLRRRLASDLRGALGRSELTLHYQPRIRLADGAQVGAEALLRWRHAKRGDVAPAAFIPVAEGSDLIVALGAWVLRTAAAAAAARPALGRLSVNVSARQILTGALPGQVEAALAETGLPPERLELELTETLALPEGPEVVGLLRGLRDRGIGLALDDFGAGHASLGRLRRLPFSTLKFDHSLIAGLAEAGPDLAILRALRDLGRALGLRLVAEGVEQAAQRDLLAGLGVDEAQGFLFGVPAELEPCPAAPLAPATEGTTTGDA
ncbi:EAL domain-containing protein [Paracraurococcus ruber]|uniref:EAL domain-containing protein n=1 Tax=Paracraurococcus ruber TaxID=77675 RepID=A0ABS1D9X2_9PROT|nr:EAL domain-containing protein [Paracraurococcus ruber]MBK1662689.1 hypothetical protein [Paracraurococcus ruber]TDG27395.1 EAL domain-containing protein [Paracraurococcus ruber]